MKNSSLTKKYLRGTKPLSLLLGLLDNREISLRIELPLSSIIVGFLALLSGVVVGGGGGIFKLSLGSTIS